MTLYAGELFRIQARGADFDGSALTEANTLSVGIKIYDSTATEIVDEPMEWDVDEAIWIYMWDTGILASGSYRYQVTFTGLDNKSSWEWKRVRITQNPIVSA